MVWNTIAHPKMMVSSASNGTMRRPIKYVDTAKQSVYDMIIGADYSGSGMPTPVLVHGDYETIYRMLMNDEFIRVAAVYVAGADDEKKQVYNAVVWHSIAITSGMGTVNGKPLIVIDSTAINSSKISPEVYFLASNNVLYMDPSDIPVDGKEEK